MERGEFGTIYSIQMRYIQSWGMSDLKPMQWRFDEKRAGSGKMCIRDRGVARENVLDAYANCYQVNPSDMIIEIWEAVYGTWTSPLG